MNRLSFKTKFTDAIKKSTHWLMPRTCLSCNTNLSQDYPVCDDCYATLPFLDSACQQCGQPFAAELDYCGRCIISPPSYERCICAFHYRAPIDLLIRKFKYSQRPELAMSIARLLKREIDAHNLTMPDLLIPVPLHISKLRERGFNQSLELCKSLSKLLNIPYTSDILVKHKATPPQAQQTRKSRQNNIKNSFSCKNKLNVTHVALIDDVVTSGSTVEEITKILKRNGVDYIEVWGVAHST